MLPPPPFPAPRDSPEVAELKRQLYLAHLKIALLEEKLRLARLRRWGAAAEKLSPEQLALLEGEPGVSEAEVVAEAEREPLPERAASTVESKAYEHLSGPEIVLAACWARGALWARRKFYEAAKVAPRQALPARIVAR